MCLPMGDFITCYDTSCIQVIVIQSVVFLSPDRLVCSVSSVDVLLSYLLLRH
jgi:hypothetical protein